MNTIHLKGCIPAPITIHGKIDRQLPEFTVTFKDGNTVLQQVQVKRGGTATYNGTVPAKDGNEFLGWVLTESSNPIVDSDDVTAYQQIPNVQADITCWAVYSDKRIIHDSWADISQYSQAGTAQNHYSVGDMKRIHIEGTVGTLAVNQDVYVYILGFDHNSTLEGNGITFGCFKDVNDLTDIALVDSFYWIDLITDGAKVFNVNHWGDGNYGGWAGSDLRYDILGSTDVAPTGYGSAPDSLRVGYNATSMCATSPITNTLMSCLPSDLRVVMKPITKYTNNTGNSSDVSASVTASIDYLPLLSEYEIWGVQDYANQYEQAEQAQYAYFVSESSKIKYKHNNSTIPCHWWERSPASWNNFSVCLSTDENIPSTSNAATSGGLAPIFLV